MNHHSFTGMAHRMRVLRWILALVALLTWFGGMGLALTPDGLVLMEFKNGLTTISHVLESWNTADTSPCSWGGINCTDSGHMRTIILPTQEPKLEGSTSASLGKLESLEVLWLDDNLLSGIVPPEIGNLYNLTVLSLSFQNFSGEIPPQLANCRSLVEFWLNGNNFTGDMTSVLEWLSTLPAIEQRRLEGNGDGRQRPLRNIAPIDWKCHNTCLSELGSGSDTRAETWTFRSPDSQGAWKISKHNYIVSWE